jgi:ankyrin repeat protein
MSDDIFAAAYRGDVETVRRFLDEDAALAHARSPRWEDGTPLTVACVAGHLAIVQMLLAAGASADAQCGDGSALLMAAWGEHEPVVRQLLDAGADPKLASASGETPLMTAALKGSVAIARLLIDGGAEVNAQTTSGASSLFATSPPVCGESALHLAAAEGHGAMVELLLSRGASKTITDHVGERPLHWAARHHRDELLELLK